jgi:hypothetical protein
MPVDRAERCDHCRFWQSYDPEPDAAEATGECHRHAPTPEPLHDTNQKIGHLTYWPLTSASHWCGEFQPLTSPAQQPSARLDAKEFLRLHQRDASIWSVKIFEDFVRLFRDGHSRDEIQRAKRVSAHATSKLALLDSAMEQYQNPSLNVPPDRR